MVELERLELALGLQQQELLLWVLQILAGLEQLGKLVAQAEVQHETPVAHVEVELEKSVAQEEAPQEQLELLLGALPDG